jgi:serine protease Do
VIVQVNRKPVKSAAEFKRALEKNSGDKRVLLLLRKGDMQQYLVLRW